MNMLLLANVDPPTVSAFYIINLVVRVLHIAGVATLVGGLIYRRLVLIGHPAGEIDEATRRPWAKWIGVASGILLATGIYNTWLYMLSKQYDKLHFSYHAMWGIKFLLAMALMALAAIIAGRSGLAKKLQQNESKWLTIAIVLAFLVFAVGAAMRSYTKLPV